MTRPSPSSPDRASSAPVGAALPAAPRPSVPTLAGPVLPAIPTPFRAAWAVLLWPTRVRTSEWKELLDILPPSQQRDFDRLRNRPVMLYGFPRFSYLALPIGVIISQPHTLWSTLTGLCLGGAVMFIAERLVHRSLQGSAKQLGGSYSSLTGLSGPNWTALQPEDPPA